MKWKKLGRLYNCNQLHAKLFSHSANPLAVQMNGDEYRVYFSSRDTNKRSSVGAVDVNIVSREVIKEFNKPFFEYGDPDSFFSDGVSVGNVYEVANTKYMLFMGWSTPKNKHWYGTIGRLVVNDDFSLTLDDTTPFLDLDSQDPISLSYPWVLFDKGIYKMWYGSTLSWDSNNGEMIHVIKYAESLDGNVWEKKGIAIPYEIGVAQAFSRPTVYVDNAGKYHMWFSCRSGRGESYRIGYAFSDDGLQWIRLPNNTIDVSNSGWDSEMIEYPFVMQHNDDLLMLYNGNQYGQTGFGMTQRISE